MRHNRNPWALRRLPPYRVCATLTRPHQTAPPLRKSKLSSLKIPGCSYGAWLGQGQTWACAGLSGQFPQNRLLNKHQKSPHLSLFYQLWCKPLIFVGACALGWNILPLVTAAAGGLIQHSLYPAVAARFALKIVGRGINAIRYQMRNSCN